MPAKAPPATANQIIKEMPAFDDSLATSEDLLIEFFDFFDCTIDDVYSYIKHRTRVPEVAEDITLKLYFSLLQRRRFFWWRKKADQSQIFSMADKAIAEGGQWQEEAAGDTYAKEIAQKMPGNTEEDKLNIAHSLLKALRNMPQQEQKMAIILFFLKWPNKKVCDVYEADKRSVEDSRAALLNKLNNFLKGENLLEENTINSILDGVACIPIDNSKKAELRVAILNKFRSAQLSSLRYVMPVAAIILLVTTSASGIGYFSVSPVSMKKQVRTMAAAETLLLQTQKDTLNILARAEKNSSGVAGSYARREVANISLDLTGPAIDEQARLEYEVYNAIKKMGSKALSGIFKKLFALLH